MKSVLQKFFNVSVSHFSPVIPEVIRKVEFDEAGVELVHFVPLDSWAVIKSNGNVSDWSLDNLIKSGVNPRSMSVITSSPSRFENVGVVQKLSADVESVLDSVKNV